MENVSEQLNNVQNKGEVIFTFKYRIHLTHTVYLSIVVFCSLQRSLSVSIHIVC